MAIVLLVSFLMVRGSKLIPGRAQNVFEWFYEFLSDFGLGIAGPGREARTSRSSSRSSCSSCSATGAG